MLSTPNRFARLPEDFYTRLNPTPLRHPHWVIQNQGLASGLGIDWDSGNAGGWLHALGGGEQVANAEPLAMVYAGHQFGQYVPQLGDGRGLLLGDLDSQAGPMELHLKGAGKTPYSRFGDGRAVLRSCIREYIASEALHALGVPTTRALCITSGSETVWREAQEPVAMLTRVARSHVRFGHFEFFHYTGQKQAVQALADYCVQHDYPEIAHLQGPERYAAFLRRVAERTARLIAAWQALGFAHGVMNTDNMSIIGDTFDFGPYGFLDRYQPGFICNHSDHHGRYAFNAQPQIGLWNLHALAQALSSLPGEAQREAALACYEPVLIESYEARMRARLGLSDARQGDTELVFDWLGLLQLCGADYNNSFRTLLDWRRNNDTAALRAEFSAGKEKTAAWLERYRSRLQQEQDPEKGVALMARSNPLYLPRNHLAQEAIEQADNGNYRPLETLMAVLSKPFEQQAGREAYAAAAPPWSEHLEISCSS